MRPSAQNSLHMRPNYSYLYFPVLNVPFHFQMGTPLADMRIKVRSPTQHGGAHEEAQRYDALPMLSPGVCGHGRPAPTHDQNTRHVQTRRGQDHEQEATSFRELLPAGRLGSDDWPAEGPRHAGHWSCHIHCLCDVRSPVRRPARQRCALKCIDGCLWCWCSVSLSRFQLFVIKLMYLICG